jgi:hypothetical protein
VDEQDGGDVFLGRIPPLLLQGLEVLLLRGVEPLVRFLRVAVIVILRWVKVGEEACSCPLVWCFPFEYYATWSKRRSLGTENRWFQGCSPKVPAIALLVGS